MSLMLAFGAATLGVVAMVVAQPKLDRYLSRNSASQAANEQARRRLPPPPLPAHSMAGVDEADFPAPSLPDRPLLERTELQLGGNGLFLPPPLQPAPSSTDPTPTDTQSTVLPDLPELLDDAPGSASPSERSDSEGNSDSAEEPAEVESEARQQPPEETFSGEELPEPEEDKRSEVRSAFDRLPPPHLPPLDSGQTDAADDNTTDQAETENIPYPGIEAPKLEPVGPRQSEQIEQSLEQESSPSMPPISTSDESPALGTFRNPTQRDDALLWWIDQVNKPFSAETAPLEVSLDSLALATVRFSHDVQALQLLPQIRCAVVQQQRAAFDVQSFVDSKWTDRDEPVGDFLATGGGSRLLEDTLAQNVGVRRRTQTGAEVEFSQQFTAQDSNSQFFTPANQAQTRMSLSITQPLLRGSGVSVNRSLIVIAQHDARVAWDTFAAGLQDRLLEVSQQYWRLYYQRSLVLQRERNLERAYKIVAELRSRERIDALRSQIARAEGKVANREATLIRARAEVRNAEAQLRSLINAPSLDAAGLIELLPADVPICERQPIAQDVARQIALKRRVEIDNVMAQIQAAAVRLDVAENQLLPSLGLILESYVNGIRGNYTYSRSFTDQFLAGAPSYTAGLTFEMPIGNRRAKAEYRQRQLELQQLYRELHATTARLSAEVEVAVREVEVAFAELQSGQKALRATREEVDYLAQRWRLLPGVDQSSSFLLEDLLNAEDRLVEEEQRVAAAILQYVTAQVQLKRALGMLVSPEQESGCQPDQFETLSTAIDTRLDDAVTVDSPESFSSGHPVPQMVAPALEISPEYRETMPFESSQPIRNRPAETIVPGEPEYMHNGPANFEPPQLETSPNFSAPQAATSPYGEPRQPASSEPRLIRLPPLSRSIPKK